MTLNQCILNEQQLNALKVGDKIDHKAKANGKYWPSEIVNKSGIILIFRKSLFPPGIGRDARLVKLVNTADLKSAPLRVAGSSPAASILLC